jgi:alpha-N-acetylglucosamine transferase
LTCQKQVEPALVLTNSLKLSNTTYPVLVVLDDSVLKQYEGHFRELEANIVQVHQEDCNVAKMALWSLTKFDKIAYIDPISVVVKVGSQIKSLSMG